VTLSVGGRAFGLYKAALQRLFSVIFVRLGLCDFRAADEYIVRHFSAENWKVLRIYNKERRAATVSPDVKKFCLMKDGRFVDPCIQDILQSRIILTTMVTSLQLTELKLHNCFTHILIDEAAQVRSVITLLSKWKIDIYACDILNCYVWNLMIS